MTRQYLKNAELDAQLVEQGYVVVPLLDKEEVNALREVFVAAHPTEIVPFYATAHHKSPEFRDEMNKAIINAISTPVDELFNNCKLLGGSFIVKTKSDLSRLEPHQDWNIVDEDKYRSFNIWMPLVDLDEKNGAIEVLPKSHNWVRGIRHSSIPCAYQQVHHLVWENMKPLYMKAGEALIYDHSLLHCSKANNSDNLRIACASGVIPNEAEMFFYWNNNGTIDRFESNPEYFMSENIFTEPVGLKKVDSIAYDFPKVDEKWFNELAGLEGPVVEQEVPKEDVAKSTLARLPFWKIYTPLNIIKEIHYRLTSGS
jgi:hypothetical protein